jgi:hypothetical protein
VTHIFGRTDWIGKRRACSNVLRRAWNPGNSDGTVESAYYTKQARPWTFCQARVLLRGFAQYPIHLAIFSRLRESCFQGEQFSLQANHGYLLSQWHKDDNYQ